MLINSEQVKLGISICYATLNADKTLKTAVYICNKKFSIKLTRRFKPYKYPRRNESHEDMVLNMGNPCYRTIAFMKKNPDIVLITKPWPKKKPKEVKAKK